MPGATQAPYLNLELIREHKFNPEDFERVIAEAALQQPHIARAYTRSDLAAGRVQRDNIGNAVDLSFYGPRRRTSTSSRSPIIFSKGAEPATARLTITTITCP